MRLMVWVMSSIYSVLQPAADRVEYCHRVQWEEATKGMSPLQYDAHIILARTCIIWTSFSVSGILNRKLHFRRGLDKFLCRVHLKLCDSLAQMVPFDFIIPYDLYFAHFNSTYVTEFKTFGDLYVHACWLHAVLSYSCNGITGEILSNALCQIFMFCTVSNRSGK